MKISTISKAAMTVAISASLYGFASAQTVSLFTTQDDFAGWASNSSFSTAVGTAGDTDDSTINGLGNTTNPGGTGTAGALDVTWLSGTFSNFQGANESGNAAFTNAWNTAVADGWLLEVDYTVVSIATPNNGGYFDLQGFDPSSTDGYYQVFNPTSGAFSQTIGSVNTAIYTLSAADNSTVPAAGGFFALGFNINQNLGESIDIDNIRLVNPAPEPASMALLGLGAIGLITRRRRK
jgi:hypothetical protein